MSLEPLPDNSACPRCQQPFRCGAADPTCACFGLNLGKALVKQLREDYSTCLCVACLVELKARQPPAPE